MLIFASIVVPNASEAKSSAAAAAVAGSLISMNLLMCLGGRVTRPYRVLDNGVVSAGFRVDGSPASSGCFSSTLRFDWILRGRPRRFRELSDFTRFDDTSAATTFVSLRFRKCKTLGEIKRYFTSDPFRILLNFNVFSLNSNGLKSIIYFLAFH